MKSKLKIIEGLISEIQKRFDNFTSVVENGGNPVSIQDLDYWKNELLKVKMELIEDELY